jgi:hypothetical protein
MDSEGGAGRRSGWDEQVAERGEDVDETLQSAPMTGTCIALSLFRNGTWEFSARLFKPLCDRCSTPGMVVRRAAL